MTGGAKVLASKNGRPYQGQERDPVFSSGDSSAAPPVAKPFNNNAVMITEADVNGMLARHVPPSEAKIRDIELYRRAMVHKSYSARPVSKLNRINARCPPGQNPLQPESYERLEFLGDSVLNLVVTSYLFERYPEEDEGFMTRMRTKLINGRMLADLCMRHTRLPMFVMVTTMAGREQTHPAVKKKKKKDGEGEGKKSQEPSTASLVQKPLDEVIEEGGEKVRWSILEDVFEAFLGALFLDRGFDLCRTWLVGFLEENVDFAELAANQDSVKAILNRYCMRNLGFLPSYTEIKNVPTGQAVMVRLMDQKGAVISTGSGTTRRDAEDVAVRRAMAYYGIAGGCSLSSS